MKKLSGIFAVSMIAIMTAGAARADIASSKYVDDQVELRVATDQGVANAGKTMVVNAEGKVAPGTVSYDDLDNKPTIPAAQVNSDWNSTEGVSQILNKPTLGDLAAKSTISNADVAADAAIDQSKISGLTTDLAGKVATDQGVANKGKTMVVNAEGKVEPGTVSYNDLDNKPTIPAAQVNSDWNSTEGVSQILNKPTLGDLAAKSTISNADVAADAAIDQSKISGLTTDLAGKQATLGATNVTTTGKGNVVTAVTAADGTVTVSKTLTLGDLATAAPGACSNTTNKCVLVFDGTAYSWEVVKR